MRSLLTVVPPAGFSNMVTDVNLSLAVQSALEEQNVTLTLVQPE